MKTLIFIIFMFPICCIGQEYNYMMRLKTVEKNGVTDSAGIQDTQTKYFENVYSDSLVQIRATPVIDFLLFSLSNKTSKKITVNFDKAILVDVTGKSHPLMSSAVKYLEKDNPQKDRIILPKSRIEDNLIPSDQVYWKDSKWNVLSFLPRTNKKQKSLLGSTMRFFIPVLVDGETIDYTFNYVMDVKTYQ